MVPRVIFGRGSFNQIQEILTPKRKNTKAPFIFLVDDVFEHNPWLIDRIPLRFLDQIIFVSADEEPKTSQVDALVDELKSRFTENPSGIIGIGGGTLLDMSKAVAIMLTNEGSAADYQGWDLVKYPGIHHIGIPTLAGTGAEVSRTTALSGEAISRRLGGTRTSSAPSSAGSRWVVVADILAAS